MTTDLAAWLLACIDEDERRASAASVKQDDPQWYSHPVVRSVPRHFTVRSTRDRRPIARVQDLAGDDEADTVGILDGDAVAGHIAEWDPTRALAECDAKRRRIELHRPSYYPEGDGPAGDCTSCMNEPWPCPTLRLEGLPYVARPGYREEWRP